MLLDEQTPSYVTTKESIDIRRTRRNSSMEEHQLVENQIGRKSLRNLDEEVLEHTVVEQGSINHLREYAATDKSVMPYPNSLATVSIDRGHPIPDNKEIQPRHVASFQMLPYNDNQSMHRNNFNTFTQNDVQPPRYQPTANNTFSTPFLMAQNQGGHNYQPNFNQHNSQNQPTNVNNGSNQFNNFSFMANGIASPPTGPDSRPRVALFSPQQNSPQPALLSKASPQYHQAGSFPHQQYEPVNALSFSYPGQKHRTFGTIDTTVNQFDVQGFRENPYQINNDPNRGSGFVNRDPRAGVGNIGGNYGRSVNNLPPTMGLVSPQGGQQMNSSMYFPQQQNNLMVPQLNQQSRSTSMNSRVGRDGLPKINRLVSHDSNYYQNDTEENVSVNPLKGLSLNKQSARNGNIFVPRAGNMVKPIGPKIFDDDQQPQINYYNNPVSKPAQQPMLNSFTYNQQQGYQPQQNGQRNYRPSEMVPNRMSGKYSLMLDSQEDYILNAQRRFSIRPYGL